MDGTKILGILGSPRSRGNTEVLLRAAAEGVAAVGGAFEWVRLADGAVRECDGCHVCWSGKSCAKKDAMNEIYPKIAVADGVIFGTPVYWYGPTALMKMFMDRFVYFNCEANREQIRGTVAATIIPFEETNPETAAPVTDFFSRALSYLEMPIVDQLTVPGVTRRGEVKQQPDRLASATELGRRVVEAARKS